MRAAPSIKNSLETKSSKKFGAWGSVLYFTLWRTKSIHDRKHLIVTCAGLHNALLPDLRQDFIALATEFKVWSFASCNFFTEAISINCAPYIAQPGSSSGKRNAIMPLDL